MTKILLVEDNELNRDMLSRRLGRKGYEVVFAVSGPEAVERAAAESPGLILMDMGLPGFDGHEATRRIRAAEAEAAGARVPIIALTAYAQEEDRQRALSAGCDDYDTKPIDLKRLLGKIGALLGA